MTFTLHESGVTLELSHEDFACLHLLIGYGSATAMGAGDVPMFWRWMAFANRVNEGNPNYTPYEIPEKFQVSS